MVSLALLALMAASQQLPAAMPPAGSPPVVRVIEIRFPTQGNVSAIDPATYLYYIETKPSRPSAGVWVPYDKEAPLGDFKRLWATGFLDDLSIEVTDEPYENGVIGKHIIYNLEERPRVKIIDYEGSKVLEYSKIDEALKEADAVIRADSFLDPRLVHRGEQIVGDLLREKGYQFAKVTHRIRELAGSSKTVHLTYLLDTGPQVRLAAVTFVGNDVYGDGTLRRRMKSNKPRQWYLPSFLSRKASYQPTKFEEDADQVLQYYRDRGYVSARVGDPEMIPIRDSKDKKTRWVEMRIPVSEGKRYRVGDFNIDGNTVVKSEALRSLFSKVKAGKFYQEKAVRKGLEKAREVYGTGGYFEFTGYPDLKPRDQVEPGAPDAASPSTAVPATTAAAAPATAKAASEKPKSARAIRAAQRAEAARAAKAAKAAKAAEAAKAAAAAKMAKAAAAEAAKASKPAKATRSSRRARPVRPLFARRPRAETGVLDVTLRVQEGKQYFVNRLSFKGNSVTRDNVIRREMALAEGAVFNTEALKYSVKRLNQLGYFRPMEDSKGIDVQKTPGVDNKVDVTLTVEEQNRNQIQFGAGVSEYDGVFGSASYTAANFLGRGETVTVAFQRGSRSNMYQVGIAEPYMFDRPISASIDVYSRKYNYYTTIDTVAYSEVREGVSFSIGRPLKRFSRASVGYTYEVIDSAVNKDLLKSTSFITVSNATTFKSKWSKNKTTVSAAGMPTFNAYLDQGRHLDSRIVPVYVLNTVDNPMTPHSGKRFTGSLQFASRSFGGSYNYTKAEGEAIWYIPTSRKTGFGLRAEAGWLRMYGRTDDLPYYHRYFLGGEYQIRGVDIRTVGPIDENNRSLGGNKFLLFNAEYYVDIAGPVRALVFHDAGQAFEEGANINLRDFRTSSGVEVRVLVPMLNVPFRLIWAWNTYRDSFQPARAFKFAVGTTF